MARKQTVEATPVPAIVPGNQFSWEYAKTNNLPDYIVDQLETEYRDCAIPPELFGTYFALKVNDLWVRPEEGKLTIQWKLSWRLNPLTRELWKRDDEAPSKNDQWGTLYSTNLYYYEEGEIPQDLIDKLIKTEERYRTLQAEAEAASTPAKVVLMAENTKIWVIPATNVGFELKDKAAFKGNAPRCGMTNLGMDFLLLEWHGTFFSTPPEATELSKNAKDPRVEKRPSYFGVSPKLAEVPPSNADKRGGTKDRSTEM